jgi:hypothetical protein
MNACAFVVGPAEGTGAAVFDMAGRLGFGTVLAYDGIPCAEQQAGLTPVCYFLFAEVADPRTLAGPAQAIRFSTGRRVRFSPLVYFCEHPSVEVIRTCIDIGFDDVITFPFTRQRVGDRLRRQVDTEFVYFETSSYFGPDRRSRIEAVADEQRGRGQHRRLQIVRNLVTGINVLRDDLQVVP